MTVLSNTMAQWAEIQFEKDWKAYRDYRGLWPDLRWWK